MNDSNNSRNGAMLNPDEMLGIVVIGRNEGERLKACLTRFQKLSYPLVYVDSDSKDGSAELAREMGFYVHEINQDHTPLSAARARNEGFVQLCRMNPMVKYVQFIDGDCIVEDDWLSHAQNSLRSNSERAVVIGHLTELRANYSVYNQLCALEWRSPCGDLKNYGSLGGIMMVKAEIFKKLDGFNATVIAGEDSEFGVRVGLSGHTVTKLDYPMAIHDANIAKFSQWWTRSVRAGHAIGQRLHLNGVSANDCVRESRSTLFWGVLLPLSIIALAIPTKGLSIALLVGYVHLGLKVYRYRREMGDSHADAVLYSRYLVVSKLANGLGLIKFHINRFKKRYEIIEYK